MAASEPHTFVAGSGNFSVTVVDFCLTNILICVYGHSMSQVDEDHFSVPLLEMRGIVKVFPGVRALDGVDLQVRAGEVHCLLGQNGAGKSTLIKVMAGAHTVDEGEVLWRGQPASLSSPVAALQQGIATIYQELDLVDWLSVGENIFLGHELASGGFSQRAATRRRTRELMARLGHPEISPNREVGSLSAAGKQIVSVARALSRDARLIVMDEPSAVLDGEEVENLFHIVSDLAADGVAVVYISHRLEEIRRIGDRITVLKDGRTVATGLDARTTPTADLIKLMTGRSIEYVFPPRSVDPPSMTVPPLLSVSDLTRRGEFESVNFDVRPGEIVGLAGLVGAGRSEIIETIFGARRSHSGTVQVGGSALRNGSVRSAVQAGMGLCPEERKSQGLILDQAVYQNISMATIDRFSAAGFIRDAAERSAAMEVAAKVDVRPADPDRVVRTLSGGNQQKIVLARWLLRRCKVLLLDEPTRGVDVGARSEIYLLIRELADSGVAVVVVSSEVEEVLGLADRVLVVAAGRVLHDGPAADIDENQVLDLIMGGTAA
jgi:ribose transport system ATP-binding protein